jgi:hypothetical protein
MALIAAVRLPAGITLLLKRDYLLPNLLLLPTGQGFPPPPYFGTHWLIIVITGRCAPVINFFLPSLSLPRLSISIATEV